MPLCGEPVFGRGNGGLSPATADPHVAVAVTCPMAAHPNGSGSRTGHPSAANPYPATIPSPITRRPDIIGARGDRDYLDSSGRWGGRSHDYHLRRRGNRLRRGRLRRHGSRGWSWSLPVGRWGRGRWLGLVNDRRRIRLLDHVSRLSVVNRHIGDLPLRTASGQSRDTRERRARDPYFSLHKIKVIHIYSVGRYAHAAS